MKSGERATVLKPYTTIQQDARIELIVKRSRFIGNCVKIDDEDAARKAIAAIQKEFWDASHNCFAYVTGVLGTGSEIQRSSDAGEPSGTAGQPILDAIAGKGLSGALVVVTRYFGGTLLGRGGLVQAYSKTASMALESAGRAAFVPAVEVMLAVSYPMLARVEAFLQGVTHVNENVQYAENVTLELLIPLEEKDEFSAKVVELSDGRIMPIFGEEKYYAF